MSLFDSDVPYTPDEQARLAAMLQGTDANGLPVSAGTPTNIPTDPSMGLMGMLQGTDANGLPVGAGAPANIPTDPSMGLMGVAALAPSAPSAAMSLFDPDNNPQPGSTPTAPVPQPKPSILERISQRIKEATQGDAPSGYNSLLTPDQIEAARPTLFQTIFGHGADPKEFQANLKNAVQLAQVPAALVQQQKYKQIQTYLANKYAPQDGDTLQDTRDRYMQMAADGARLGADPDWLKDVNSVASEIAKEPKPVAPKIEWQDFGGKSVAFLPGSVTPVASFDHTPSQFEKDKFAEEFAATEQNRQFMQNQKEIGDAQSSARTFAATNKPLSDTAAKYATFLSQLDQVKHGNPAALQSFLYQTVNNVDTNAQMKQGILNKLEKVAPGVSRNFNMLLDTKLNGKIPDQTIQDIENMVRPLHQSLKNLYTQRYNAAAGSIPQFSRVAADLAPDTIFDIPGAGDTSPVAGGTSPVAGGKVRKYLPQ